MRWLAQMHLHTSSLLGFLKNLEKACPNKEHRRFAIEPLLLRLTISDYDFFSNDIIFFNQGHMSRK